MENTVKMKADITMTYRDRAPARTRRPPARADSGRPRGQGATPRELDHDGLPFLARFACSFPHDLAGPSAYFNPPRSLGRPLA